MYPPLAPEYIPGTPEYAAREAAQERHMQETRAREAQAVQDKLDRAARAEAEALEKKEKARAAVEQKRAKFHARATAFGDAAEIDAMLASQAAQMDELFAQSIEAYAGVYEEDARARIHSGIALRAQNHCRMTLMTRLKMREYWGNTTLDSEKKKIEDPAIQKERHEQMDTGNAPQAGGTDPQMAAVEDGGTQNG